MRARILAMLVSAPPLLCSCALGYYAHVTRGQLDVLDRSEPIIEILADESSDPDLRRQLATVLEIRDYASTELGLPENDSYRSYADLERPYVVWNVFAAAEFSVEAKTWCFLVVGCVAYRGYFDEDKARAFAHGLGGRGYDVYVGGVPAYSTLGRFDDPVLNTMLYWDESRLAAIVFHELAHQVLYVKGDAGFSEAFATAVEEEGVRRWLLARGNEGAYGDYQMERQRRAVFTGIVARGRERLRELYASGFGETELRKEKQRVLGEMREDYARASSEWHDFIGYGPWFESNLNNAKLVSVSTYQRLVPAFRALLARADGDFERFFTDAGEIADLPETERQEHMRALLAVSGTAQASAEPGS